MKSLRLELAGQRSRKAAARVRAMHSSVTSRETRETRDSAQEIKFLLSSAQGDRVRAWALRHMDPDPNADASFPGGYLVSSIYFDTPRLDVFRRNGSFGRSKYRIRRYGGSEIAFLERKLKTENRVAKRRSWVDLPELKMVCSPSGPDATWQPGFWFQRRLALRGLAPVCQISYSRIARVAQTGAGLARLTLDQNLRALPASCAAFQPWQTGVELLEGHLILELKYRSELPRVFKDLLEEIPLARRSVSKYRLAAQRLLPVGTECNA